MRRPGICGFRERRCTGSAPRVTYPFVCCPVRGGAGSGVRTSTRCSSRRKPGEGRLLDSATPTIPGDQLAFDGEGWDGTSEQRDLGRAIAEFSTFPYQKPPLAARNWGHPLHSLCSYPSKMKPGMAATLIRLFTSPAQLVLDPFAGVGTLPFEACAAGRVGIAVDLSPFAYGVSAAKVRPPATAEARETFGALAEAVSASQSADVDPTEGDAEIAEFFHPATWAEVRAARAHFLSLERERATTPGHWLVKAALAHILHGNRPYALSRRSHGIIPIPPKGEAIYKPLLQGVKEKLARTRFDQLPPRFISGEAHLAPAQKLPLGDGSVDAVITSPPFLGTTDFLRQNRVRLWFYGMDYAEQARNRRGSDFLEGQRDMAAYAPILGELVRVLRPGGLVVFHLGVVGRRDMAQELEPLAQGVGLSPVATIYEDASHLETHGRTARGATAQHEFLFLVRPTTPA